MVKNWFKMAKEKGGVIELDSISYDELVLLIKESSEIYIAFKGEVKDGNQVTLQMKDGYLFFRKGKVGVAVNRMALFFAGIENLAKDNFVVGKTLKTNVLWDEKNQSMYETGLTKNYDIVSSIQLLDLVMSNLLEPPNYQTDSTWKKLMNEYYEMRNNKEEYDIVTYTAKLTAMGYLGHYYYMLLEDKIRNILNEKMEEHQKIREEQKIEGKINLPEPPKTKEQEKLKISH